MMGMKRTKASSSEAALADVVEQAKVVEGAEGAKTLEDMAAAAKVTFDEMRKRTERQAVLDRLADKILAASAAQGGVPVFLKDIQCK